MVKNPVKVYARLRDIESVNEATVYSIRKKENYDILTLYKYAKHRNKYKFHQIFDQNSNQEEVFENTTRPIVNSVLHGFNGTIFAYGQTGSGKTYSMTGCSDVYENRGIIPRCIQEIFQFTNKSPDQYTIFISYMEIYNEIGYDLLNPKHQATKLEELPRVTLLDDGKGEAHLRNLFKLSVHTEQDAMRLLFLGDTNRTIAETPMNDYSSRSHCIFTIYITRNENERKIRKSKLNLVDLAGSERIYKTNISGTTLTEAKNINLSLHYLEQVILALSQSKRSHIPFRNSMMTYMLRDSLSGNSITVMLATLSIKSTNLEETVTTCNFSQRVALVKTDAIINEIFDPLEEIDYLRNEVTNLRRKLSVPANSTCPNRKECSEAEKEFCKTVTEQYLKTGIWNTALTLNIEQFIKCFQIFRDIIVSDTSDMPMKQEVAVPTDEYSCTKNDIVEKFKEIIQQKDEEIDILTKLLEACDLSKNQEAGHCLELHSNSLSTTPRSKVSAESEEEEPGLSANEECLFEEFLGDSNNNAQLKNLRSQIESKCQSAEQITAFVESCQQNILRLRRKLEMGHGITDDAYVNQIQNCLKSQQDVYAKSIENLKQIKEETEFLEHGLKQERIRLEQKFRSRRKESAAKLQQEQSAQKSKSDSGIFTRLNESLKNIERKFSAKVKIPTKNSPRKAESELLISHYKEKRSKAAVDKVPNMPYTQNESKSYIDKLEITSVHEGKVPVVNLYAAKTCVKSLCENNPCVIDMEKQDNTRQISTKTSIRRITSTAKIIQQSSKSSDKWDTLKKEQNDFYSNYGDPPGNITRFVARPTNSKPFPNVISCHQDEIIDLQNKNIQDAQIQPNLTTNLDCNAYGKASSTQHATNKNFLQIGKRKIGHFSRNVETHKSLDTTVYNLSENAATNASLNNNLERNEVDVKANKSELSDNDSDSVFEKKIQSYLKKVPSNPYKDNQPYSLPNATGDHIYDESGRHEPQLSVSNGSKRRMHKTRQSYNKKTTENSNTNINYSRHLNRNVNGTPDDEINIIREDSSIVHNFRPELDDHRYKTGEVPRNVKNQYQQNLERIGRIQMNDNRINNRQVTLSDNEEEDITATHHVILQEDHIPEKDVIISHRSSSSNYQQQPEEHRSQHQTKTVDKQNNMFLDEDSPEFVQFMDTIPLTGDADVDEEIVKFYRTKFTQE